MTGFIKRERERGGVGLEDTQTLGQYVGVV